MWTCPKDNETNPANFDKCWRCETLRPDLDQVASPAQPEPVSSAPLSTPPPSPSPLRPRPLQQWEYLFVGFSSADDQYRLWAHNGVEIEDWEEGPTLADHCNVLGSEGWEMVSHSYDAENDVILISMKRRL